MKVLYSHRYLRIHCADIYFMFERIMSGFFVCVFAETLLKQMYKMHTCLASLGLTCFQETYLLIIGGIFTSRYASRSTGWFFFFTK